MRHDNDHDNEELVDEHGVPLLDAERISRSRFDKERIGILVDATMAIGMTLLGVEMPSAKEFMHGGAQSQREYFFNYAISFLLLGELWAKNVWMTTLLETVSLRTIHINLVWLLFASFIPLSYSVFLSGSVGENHDEISNHWARFLSLIIVGSILAKDFQRYTEGGYPDFTDFERFRQRAFRAGPANPEKLFMLTVLSLIPAIFAFGFSYVLPSSQCLWFMLAYSLVLPFLIPRLLKFDDHSRGHVIDKIRLIQISDGVFAISSTLMIIDVEQVKTVDDINPKAYILMGYFVMSFSVVFALWGIHQVFFAMVDDQVSSKVHFINTVSLLPIPIISAGFKSLFKATHSDEKHQGQESVTSMDDEDKAIRNSALYILLPVMFTCMTFLVTLGQYQYFESEKLMHSQVHLIGRRYVLRKITALLLLSLVAMITCFIIHNPSNSEYIIYFWFGLFSTIWMS